MSSSVVALTMAISLLLQMHACMARHPSRFLSFTQLEDADKTKLVHHAMDINGFPVFEEAKKISSEDVAFITVDKNARPVMEMQGFEGVKPRAVLESNESHNKTKKATNANGGEPVGEAATDEDYVQTHRRSPIHNHH